MIRSTTRFIKPSAAIYRLYSTKPSTYYALFPKSFPQGPPPSGPFKVNKNELRREFLQLQSLQHPDKATNNEENEKFSTQSAQLNHAYRLLLDPLSRAEHILLTKGIDALAEKDTLTDEDLLMDVLMSREAINEAESAEDLEQLKKDNAARISESEEILENAFKEEDMETARKETVKLSYWQSIAKSIGERN